MEPKIVKEYIDFKTTKVLAIGHGELTKNDIIKLCRDNDKPQDWSFDISNEDIGCKREDSHYEIDYKAMQTATSQGSGINNIGETYWLASRHIGQNMIFCNFSVKSIYTSGSTSDNYLCYVYADGNTNGNLNETSITHGLRPCITLKSSIKIVSGNGTMESPYILGT